MKTKLLLAVLFVALTTMGFECINDPIIVALKLDVVTVCAAVNTGNGQFNSSTTIVVRDLIPESFRDKLKGLRIYDIRVYVKGPYPTGNVNVNGDGYVKFPTTQNIHLLNFQGQYSAFANGVSLLNSRLITLDAAGLAQVLPILTNVSQVLNTTVMVSAIGGGPPVTQSFSVCIEVYFQADADAK